MNEMMSDHLGDLALTLKELRLRVRQSARLEVARAVGEALRDFALEVIGGADRMPAPRHAEYAPWNDSWRDDRDDPWQAHAHRYEEVRATEQQPADSSPLPAAIVVGWSTARWGFYRTGQLAPAAILGLIAALAASAGGPTVQALLDAWSTANDLLQFPSQRKPQ